MSFKAVMRSLTIGAILFLGVAGTVGTAAVANAAVGHADTCTVTTGTTCPGDGGTGNG